jgi:thiosulfate dehydrogenase
MKNSSSNQPEERLLRIIQRLNTVAVLLILLIMVLPLVVLNSDKLAGMLDNLSYKAEITPYVERNEPLVPYIPLEKTWIAPNPDTISDANYKAEVLYGRELVVSTAKYLGPKGSVRQLSNGLNCQNCHLDGGTRPYGNNYGSVASMYPKFRARSGTEEDIPKRINDCFERSLNGQPLALDSREMKAMVAYMNFLGSNVPKGEKAAGSGFRDLAFLPRAASPEKGKLVYDAKCASCHMEDGQGRLNPDGVEYSYPPLWGPHSFNDAAGLHRLTNMAKYVKYNMPFGVMYNKPDLSDEEAWDVSAYVISQARPHKKTPQDWPDISKKPIDHPFGPFADKFSEVQHKYGPFGPIEDARKN